MKFTLDENTTSFAVTAYAPGWIRVGEQRIEQACVVTPDGVLDVALPAEVSELNISHFDTLKRLEPEIVLLGTGTQQIFPDYDLLKQLAREGIALECMDTGAACRSYNVLLAESRPIAAMLYMR